MNLSQREEKFYNLATIGGMEIKDAYGEAYSHKDSKVLMTCLSRKKKARPDLFDAINKHKQELFDLSKKTQRETVIHAAKENALQAIEKREILRQIMTGEMIIEQEIITVHPVTKMKRISVIKRRPSYLDRIRAVELDSKIAGHFAPNTFRAEFTGRDGAPLKPKMEIDWSKIPDEVLEILVAAITDK